MPEISLPGILLIAGLVLFLAGCFYIDRRASKKFKKEISEKYPAQDSCNSMFVTAGGELLYYWPTGSVAGYKKWNLNDIACVAVYKDSFGVYDANMKALCGEYLSPSKKHVTDRAVNFPVGGSKAREYAAFIRQHGPHIQYQLNGKIQN